MITDPSRAAQRRLKVGYLVLEGLNSLATVYYFYYLYFFMERRHGFGGGANLALAALNGGLYMVFAWGAGRFAQRFGYYTALKIGFATMIAGLALGSGAGSALTQIISTGVIILGMSFTWPTLEAMVSEGESRAGLQHMLGVYNVVWAATAAVSYFAGGALINRLGLSSLFYLPAAVHLAQLVLVFFLEARAAQLAGRAEARGGGGLAAPVPVPHPLPPGGADKFLRMAWLANPFGYIAINTLLAAMPGVAQRLGLSLTMVGLCCSVWCFARLGAFWVLWRWTGWHYRFRWLLAAFVGLIGAFTVVLAVPSLPCFLLAQIVLGAGLGLLYYSSLFYSMDLSDAKGEHGGIHEAAIGFGNCAGPAVGAASLHFLPQYANSGVFAVSSLLVVGLALLVSIQLRPLRSPG